jgi:DNA polymerase-3 subunit epsilon
MSINERRLAATPLAIIDVETTGLSPRHDRIVEIAVVVMKPGEEPRLVLQSLVNPERPVTATEIHGLSDEDLAGAPTFAEVADVVVAALANRVTVAYNAEFDVALLSAELERCGFAPDLPYLCAMLLPRLMDPTAPRLSLASACAREGVVLAESHTAAGDALATAQLARRYLGTLRKQGATTFADLHSKAPRDYRFLRSFEWKPFSPPRSIHSDRRLKPRTHSPTRQRVGLAAYLDGLLDALEDLRLTDEEVGHIEQLRESLSLHADEVRAVHAKVFEGMLSRFVEDVRIDVAEVERLHQLHVLLSRLGWAPGDPH